MSNNDDSHESSDEEEQADSLAYLQAPNSSPVRFSEESLYQKCTYEHPHDTDQFAHSCAKYHVVIHSSSSPAFFVMLIGIDEYERQLLLPPFHTKKKEATVLFRPSNEMMAAEVERRAYFISKTYASNDIKNPFFKGLPKPAQWRSDVMVRFLKKHQLVYSEMDQKYLKDALEDYKIEVQNAIIKALSNKTAKAKTKKSKNKKSTAVNEDLWLKKGWENGITPNVRLIEICTMDDLKEGFMTRNDVLSRLELDARGTTSEKVPFFEIVRQRFNDRQLKITSSVMDPSLGGSVFTETHDVNWTQLDLLGISPIPDEKTCKTRYNSLQHGMGSVYYRWNQSGNGGQQPENTDAENPEKKLVNGSDVLTFLQGVNICTIYLWVQLDDKDLFGHAKSEFPKEYQAEDGQVPNCLEIKKRRQSLNSTDTLSNNQQLEQVLTLLENHYKRAEKQDMKREERSNIIAALQYLNSYLTQIKEDVKKFEEQKKTIAENVLNSEEKLINAEIQGCDRLIAFYDNRCKTFRKELSDVKESLEKLEYKCDGVTIRFQKYDLLLQKLANFSKYDDFFNKMNEPPQLTGNEETDSETSTPAGNRYESPPKRSKRSKYASNDTSHLIDDMDGKMPARNDSLLAQESDEEESTLLPSQVFALDKTTGTDASVATVLCQDKNSSKMYQSSPDLLNDSICDDSTL